MTPPDDGTPPPGDRVPPDDRVPAPGNGVSPSGSGPMPVDELEAELLALGQALETFAPPPADVARAVRDRLERAAPQRAEGRPEHERTDPDARPGGARRRRPRWRWVAAAVAVLVALLAGLTPQGQAAVARVLRFAGIEIHVGEPGPLPSGIPSPLPGEKRVTLDEARRSVRFPVLVPAELGEPGDVRVSDGGRVVTLSWPGVRLDVFDGQLDVVWRKDLGGPFPQEVTVGSAPGWWIAGPHGLTYLPRDGSPNRPVERRAGPTLVWRQGPVAYRLEGLSDLGQAKKVAESLR